MRVPVRQIEVIRRIANNQLHGIRRELPQQIKAIEAQDRMQRFGRRRRADDALRRMQAVALAQGVHADEPRVRM